MDNMKRRTYKANNVHIRFEAYSENVIYKKWWDVHLSTCLLSFPSATLFINPKETVSEFEECRVRYKGDFC